MKRVYLLLLSSAVLIIPLFAARPARAITLIPPSLEYGVKPGDKLSAKIKLFNETAQPLKEFTSTDNFASGDDNGTAKFLNTPTEDLASWITITKDPITIQPGERVEVPFDVNVPANADPGGHYAVIFFGDQPTGAAPGSQIAVSSKIAMLLILRVDGAINEAAHITTFTAGGGRTSFARLPIDFELRVGNSGNVHVRPHGSITIRNAVGGTTIVLPMNESRGAVLPKSDRLFKTSWEKDPANAAAGNFFKEIEAEWHNFAFGPYTAATEMTYGLSDDKTLQANVKFWAFPWHLLVSLLVLAVLLVVLLVLLIKRYNRWIVSRASSKPNEEKPKKV